MSIYSDHGTAVASGLTAAQAEAADRRGAVLVLAGAGTGKTKTLTQAVRRRIEVRGMRPDRLLVVTFTNRAAVEMRERIQAVLGEEGAPRWLGTFHGLGARQLRIEPEVANLRPSFDIVDADDTRRLVKRVMKANSLSDGEDGPSIGRDPLRAMCNHISRFKDNLVLPEEARNWTEAAIAEARARKTMIDTDELRAAARVYVDYQCMLQSNNAADFGDLLLWSTRAMQANATYRERWARRFDGLLADEFQDVNTAQYNWLRLLAKDHGELFVVGDDDQAVFGFRGSNVAFLRRFTKDFPGATQVTLEENFRSTGHILQAANAMIAADPGRLGKTLFTRKPAGERIEVVAFRDAEAEAAGIAGELGRRHAEGASWDEFAILYRSNALSRVLEEALVRTRTPYVVVGDVGFYARSEIKHALALLRLSATPDDAQGDEALRRVINSPARGFGSKAMDVLEAEAVWRGVPLLVALETAPLPPKARSAGLAFADAIRSVGRDPTATVADQVSMLLDATGYRAWLRESRAEGMEDKLDNLGELIDLAGSFHSARELLDHAALATGGPADEQGARVRLLTLHKSKGLEFGEVFLPAWEAGIFPVPYTDDPSEERRLAYVALTRGMRRVTISYCGYRRGYSQPSLFLDDIPAETLTLGWLRGPATVPAGPQTARPGTVPGGHRADHIPSAA